MFSTTWARQSGFILSLGCALCCLVLFAQTSASRAQSHADSDHDGLSDALEQKLLVQFVPAFMIGAQDCSNVPAEFRAGSPVPEVEAENGTIYGQAFPATWAGDGSQDVELHYYHLWRKDCGVLGHRLDTEHVAVLIRRSNSHFHAARWKALYWYSAAHENTVCDVSQIARASTLAAEDHGATVWVSPGKHASYLDRTACQRGCGADRCTRMTELKPEKIVNLGEPGFPMNGAVFVSSKAWPLKAKMETSNFPADAIARLNERPEGDIVSFRPGRHPAQGVIATSNGTGQALATSGANTTGAVRMAAGGTGKALAATNDSTGAALSHASDGTGSALQKSYERTVHALGTSLRHMGEALHATPEEAEDRPR